MRGGRIVAVGETRELRDAFPAFARVALDGRTVLPAFTDSHIHVAALGLSLRQVDLRGARSLREAVARVGEAARAARPGEWIQGGGWDKNLWPEGRFPRRDDLDPRDREPSRGAAQQGRPHGVGELRGARTGRDHARDAGSRGRHDRP